VSPPAWAMKGSILQLTMWRSGFIAAISKRNKNSAESTDGSVNRSLSRYSHLFRRAISQAKCQLPGSTMLVF